MLIYIYIYIYIYTQTHIWDFQGGTSGKEPACWCRRHETWVRSLGWEDPLEEGIATHSSILAWGVPWTEEPGGLQYMGLQELDTTERVTHHQHTGGPTANKLRSRTGDAQVLWLSGRRLRLCILLNYVSFSLGFSSGFWTHILHQVILKRGVKWGPLERKQSESLPDGMDYILPCYFLLLS